MEHSSEMLEFWVCMWEILVSLLALSVSLLSECFSSFPHFSKRLKTRNKIRVTNIYFHFFFSVSHPEVFWHIQNTQMCQSITQKFISYTLKYYIVNYIIYLCILYIYIIVYYICVFCIYIIVYYRILYLCILYIL